MEAYAGQLAGIFGRPTPGTKLGLLRTHSRVKNEPQTGVRFVKGQYATPKHEIRGYAT